MDKRILKIDVDKLGYQDVPECRAYLSGKDADGDTINVTLTGFDAQQLLRLAQTMVKHVDETMANLSTVLCDEDVQLSDDEDISSR